MDTAGERKNTRCSRKESYGRKDLFDMDFLLDVIPGVMIVYKFHASELEVMACSAGIEKVSGWSAKEFISLMKKDSETCVYENDKKRFEETVKKIIKTHSSGEMIYRGYRKDGAVVWLWFKGRYMGEEDGAPMMEAVFLDISSGTNMYQSVLDEATAMITVIDAQTYEILYANKAAIEITKDQPGTYIGSICYDYIAHLNRPCAHCMMNRATPKEYEVREVDYGNHSYHQLFKFIQWNNRKALLEYSEDVTEQKQNIRYAEEQKNIQSNILNNVPAGILVFRIEKDHFSIVEANPAVCEIMGIDARKAKGADNQNVIQLTHPDDVQIVLDAAKKLSVPNTRVTYEYRDFYRSRNEYVWVSAEGRSMRHADGSVYAYISYTDITAKKEVEKLQKNLMKAEQSAEAKAEFYSRMSHDMRTPMNGILGITELAAEETDIEELHKDIKKIEQSGKYMLNLINDTLDFQRIETGRMKLEQKIVYCKELEEDIITMLLPSAKSKGVELFVKNVNVQLDCYVKTDAIRLKQIIVNLLSNALKFTPPGGKTQLLIKEEGREGRISHDCLIISDTGIGMSKAFLEHGIFQPFSQEDNSMTMQYPGSGLGLSIVKSLVELMGGTIEVESEQGNGTTFTIRLDLELVPKEEAEKKYTEESGAFDQFRASLRGRRILLCEDHPLNAEIVKRMLAKNDCRMDWAKDGEEGLHMFLQSEKGFYDAILMDIRMPKMDGIETTRRIRKSAHPDACNILMIAMSANAYEEDCQKSVDAGMNAHLPKPVDAQRLFQTLSQYLTK